MKKKAPLMLIIFLLTVSFSACSDKGNTFEAKSYMPEGIKLSGNDIRVTNREILAIPSDDDPFHINYAESVKEFYDISVSKSGVLTMVSKSDKEWTDYIGINKFAGSKQITVQIPDAALSTLTLCTTREDISLPALTVTDQLTLSTNGGDIDIEFISE